MRLACVITVLFSAVTASYACKCMPAPSPVTNLRKMAEWQSSGSELIFEARAEKIELKNWPLRPVVGQKYQQPSVLVTLRTLRMYRGTLPEKVVLATGAGGGDCGYEFEENRSYLVYAFRAESGQLATEICSATQPLETAGAFLRLLRGEPPTAEDTALLEAAEAGKGKICGQISRPADSPPVRMRVMLWHTRPPALMSFVEMDASTETESDGSFCLAVKPGKYLVQAEKSLVAGELSREEAQQVKPEQMPSRYIGFYAGGLNIFKATPVEVKRNQAVSGVSFAVVQQPLYSIQGRVEGAKDLRSKAARTVVVLQQFDHDTDSVAEFKSAEAEPDGSFEVAQVPPGRYSAFAFVQGHDSEMIVATSPVTQIIVSKSMEPVVLRLSGKNEP
jgi:hypothetical protein